MSLQTRISNLMKMSKSTPYSQKTLWEKEKLLIRSNFSFSHSVFKRLILQTRINQGFLVKGLTLYHIIPTFNVPQGRRLWKTMREKEKMLVTIIFFPFPHNASYFIKEQHLILHLQMLLILSSPKFCRLVKS